ncbi:unnamed protein product [Trifolium pratense]|uniref:Uncharacterized protein n=1 Tax=Trifolium pratense TaxID=57577 RepID=A0ACB0JZ30_TRIPR|nr:unnamed protein product [Trifolium pratense]
MKASCNCFVLGRSHEHMSVNMVDYIVGEHNIDIDSQMLTRVKVHYKKKFDLQQMVWGGFYTTVAALIVFEDCSRFN